MPSLFFVFLLVTGLDMFDCDGSFFDDASLEAELAGLEGVLS